MDYFTFEKKEKEFGVTVLISFQEGQIFPHSPHILGIFSILSIKGDFCHLYIACYLYEVIQHYNAKKEEKKPQGIIGAHPGIDPGPLVPKSDTITTRL